ncbi:MAG: hypothetical protein RSB93_01040 [Rikenellaceae bacterium]
MKKINITALLLSLIVLVIACSAISISSAPENYRWACESINPLNGIEAIAFVVSYLLHTGGFITYILVGSMFVILWRVLYALFRRLASLFHKMP